MSLWLIVIGFGTPPSICDNYPASKIGIDDSFIAFRILPSKVSSVVQKRVKKTVETAIRILGMRFCAAHTELLITPKGDIKIIETASRLGGYRPLMYNEAYGLSLSRKLLDAALNKKVTRSNKPAKKIISLMEVFPTQDGRLASIEGLIKLESDPQVNHIKKLEPGEKVGLARNGFPPALRFLISASTYKDVYQKSLYYQKELKICIN